MALNMVARADHLIPQLPRRMGRRRGRLGHRIGRGCGILLDEEKVASRHIEGSSSQAYIQDLS